MRTLFCLTFLFLISGFSFAGSDEFSYDKDNLQSDFKKLDDINLYVEKNPMPLSELKKSNSELTSQIKFGEEMGVAPMFGIEDMDLGSFAWGICCWPVGIFTVLLKDPSTDEKTSFLIGFIINILFLGGGTYCYIF